MAPPQRPKRRSGRPSVPSAAAASRALRFIFWCAPASLVVEADYCHSPVWLPAELAEINEDAHSKCPPEAKFLKGLPSGGIQSHIARWHRGRRHWARRTARRLGERDSDDGATTHAAASTAEPTQATTEDTHASTTASTRASTTEKATTAETTRASTSTAESTRPTTTEATTAETTEASTRSSTTETTTAETTEASTWASTTEALVDGSDEAEDEDGNETPVGDDYVPQDCRHELAIKLLWHELHRDDVHQGSVRDGKDYWAQFYRATPNAITPTWSFGRLTNIHLHIPGMHSVGGFRFPGEIHLQHEGIQRTLLDSPDRPNFTMVVPIEVTWVWDTPLNPVLLWLARGLTGNENLWVFNSWMTWLRNPAYLYSSDIMPGGSRAVYYDLGHGCGHTFVLTKSISVFGNRLDMLKQYIKNETVLEEQFIRPTGVFVGSALRPFESFTVFSSGEMRARIIVFETLMWCSMLLYLIALVLVKKCAVAYELELTDFARDPWVERNLLADHWLVTGVMIAMPLISFANGSTNIATGMPYEYKLSYFVAVMVHMWHELIMLVQVGGAVRRITYYKLLQKALKSFAGLIHYELFVCFAFIAQMHGSNLGYASMVTFFLCVIVGQVWLLTARCPPTLAFSVRSFLIMDYLLQRRLMDLERMDEDSTVKRRFEETTTTDGDELLTDSGVGGVVQCTVLFADVVHFTLMIAFVLQFGPTAIVTVSLLLSCGFILLELIRLLFAQD
mmetsp:Transcript_39067/g.112854  ORF Transcript_39067/g.112854 Transcript_39067/m.112854 type:complete len:735 (+) Transcript_39067:76-2280(+)